MKNGREELKRVIGSRLKQAAKEQGLDARGLAEQLGLAGLKVTPQTIYNWWTGVRQPDLVDLQTYAEVTGKEVGWFFDPEGKQAGEAVELVLRIVWLAMEGYDLADATDRVVGGERLSPRDRRTISAGTEWVREQFIRQPGWASLPAEEQMRLLRRVLDGLPREV